MDQRALFAVNTKSILGVPQYSFTKKGIPLGNRPLFITRHTSITARVAIDGKIHMDHAARVDVRQSHLSLVSSLAAKLLTSRNPPEYLLFVVEGGPEVARVVVLGANEQLFSEFQLEHPRLSLSRFDLPPFDTTAIDSPSVLIANIYRFLADRQPDLFARSTDRFLRDPHILTQLLSHVMGLASNAQLEYISHLRILADTLREHLTDWIIRVDRDHRGTWEEFMGQRVTFGDGGVSRIIGLPGADPMGVRVGMYTVVPGEDDREQREQWRVYSYCIGDVLTDRRSFASEDAIVDRKRLQEAARYILEPLSLLRLVDEGTPPDFAFLHGPLQNAFEQYDEAQPNHTPGVSPELLDRVGISEATLRKSVPNVPSDHKQRIMWNHCIPVYLYAMHRIENTNFPVAGVVERSGGHSYTDTLLTSAVDAGIMASGVRAEIMQIVREYDVTDEFLFGCVLKEGEYVMPVSLRKNHKHRAHPKWAEVVSTFPVITATILKTSPNAFPFRVEMNASAAGTQFAATMRLLYHTALLLPNYAFPVGLDIVDSYVKIPDWLSRGVSATLASSVLAKAIQSGNADMVHQLRELLARSPRDFFFRPRS